MLIALLSHTSTSATSLPKEPCIFQTKCFQHRVKLSVYQKLNEVGALTTSLASQALPGRRHAIVDRASKQATAHRHLGQAGHGWMLMLIPNAPQCHPQ